VESDIARWLAAAVPSGFDRFVATVGTPAAEATLPSEPVLPDVVQFEAICREFGIEVLSPPGTLPS
jgi:hypothetical protein